MRILSLCIALVLLTGSVGCARQPSPKSMESMTRSYFRSYGRKYKTTPYGMSKADRVRLDQSREWHKGLVEGDLEITHSDGSTSLVRCMFQRNDPFGWKIVSWESLRQ